jgi:hypothetical protein
MSKSYSYRSRAEDKKIARRTVIYFTLTLVSIALIFFFGIPTVAKFASFLSGINKSNKVTDATDTIPPAPPHFNTLPEATNKSTLEINGNSEPGSTVKISLNNDNSEVVAGSEGNFILNVKLDDGENTLFAYAVDQAGNESQKTATYRIILDKQNPEIEITKPQDGASFSGSKQRQITIEGKTEVGASISINDRFVLVEDDGSFTFYTTLTEGNNNFDIKSKDAAGNESEKSLTVNFTP